MQATDIKLPFSEETQWQMCCLIMKFASADLRGKATIADCYRVAKELKERIEKESEGTHANATTI